MKKTRESKKKKKGVFVFKLANDDVDVSSVALTSSRRKRSELDTDMVWSPHGGPHSARSAQNPGYARHPQLFSPLCPKPMMWLLHQSLCL